MEAEKINRNHSSNMIGQSTLLHGQQSDIMHPNSILQIDTPLKHSIELIDKINDTSGFKANEFNIQNSI